MQHTLEQVIQNHYPQIMNQRMNLIQRFSQSLTFEFLVLMVLFTSAGFSTSEIQGIAGKGNVIFLCNIFTEASPDSFCI